MVFLAAERLVMADSVAKVPKGTAADFPPRKPKRANIADSCSLNRIARIICEFGAWWGASHIIVRSSRLRLAEFESHAAKRLLQHYWRKADLG
jgi:hypothetical protein